LELMRDGLLDYVKKTWPWGQDETKAKEDALLNAKPDREGAAQKLLAWALAKSGKEAEGGHGKQ
jgi:hypothetical protein